MDTAPSPLMTCLAPQPSGVVHLFFILEFILCFRGNARHLAPHPSSATSIHSKSSTERGEEGQRVTRASSPVRHFAPQPIPSRPWGGILSFRVAATQPQILSLSHTLSTPFREGTRVQRGPSPRTSRTHKRASAHLPAQVGKGDNNNVGHGTKPMWPFAVSAKQSSFSSSSCICPPLPMIL